MAQPSGRCQCGNISYIAANAPKWTALCHCESCRRAASAPIVAWMGFETEQVTWAGTQSFYHSSKIARRGFCPTCGTQMSFQSTAWPGEIHLYAVSLDEPDDYKPQLHCHHGEALAWLHVQDDLPRFDAKAAP